MSIAEIFDTMEYGPAPESASPALRWLEERGGTTQLFINGEWRPPSGGEYFDTHNPATNKPLARLAQAGAEDVDAAVAAARAALPGWQALGGHGRARFLYALARHIQRHSRLFAVMESLDNGKPIRESRDIDIPLVARHFYHHAGWAQLMETEMPGYAPLGVVGQIIPWNFPLLMLSWKIAPALAMGNTVVLKPAEFTSLTALLFADVCRDAGLPPGVVNIVTGDGRTGALIVEHPDVDKIAFTGSTEVGRIIRAATAGSGKKLSLELGGKSPFVVFDDADLESVIEGVVDAIWFNQGQVCCAGSRILVQEGVAERLVARLRERMETLRVGDPLDKAVDIGAIVAPVQLEKIRQLVDQGREEGATLWQPSWSCPQEGCFFPPTLLTDVSPASTVAQVEIFGPVVVLMTFRTPDEAVALANNTPYGLAASVWTENINLALDIAPRIKAGTVWVNSTNLFDAASGFGGYRESGYGREGGREGLWEYVKAKWEKEGERGTANGERLKKVRGKVADAVDALTHPRTGAPSLPPIDRTAKLYVGGKQARPDSGYSMPVVGASGVAIGEVGLGNRKDVRNAVEAAHKASGWARSTGHNRAQVIYYLAENLAARADEFTRRIAALTGDEGGAAREVELAIRRLYTYGAWADKWDGAVHSTPFRNVTLAMHEPIGVVGIACPDEAPLLGFVSLVAPAIAMGNTVVVVPSERHPLAATDFYQVLDTSDVPGGVVNIVTGKRDELAETLAGHDDVDAMWYFGGTEGSTLVERLSTGNMKRTFVSYGRGRDWASAEQAEGPEFLRHATNVKNIWVPYGE
ncbi:MAG: Aldehyde dehydrogenase [uncultured Gemmatimonadetes bacterium]|uniref:Aldehyde dehydrogenase n=1 Tax=uncultured Gemmatimonadota bacterium TaxID=203437 RepID=A0A6J4K9T9_9BACT|nr:MAG: Aldehyde dehydrogenase [uncultured Gemmatimonadota bacterium]